MATPAFPDGQGVEVVILPIADAPAASGRNAASLRGRLRKYAAPMRIREEGGVWGANVKDGHSAR